MSSRLVTKTLGGLYNGVSQQAQTMRLETQHTEQVNFDSTIVRGLYKRPGSRWIKKIKEAVDTTGAYWGVINRDADESYIYLLGTHGYITVWDKSGNQQNVVYGKMNFTDYSYTVDDIVRTNYLTNQSAAPNVLFNSLTVADYTFFSRSDISPAMTADVAEGSDSYTNTVTEHRTSYYTVYEGSTTTTVTKSDGTVVVTTITIVITGHNDSGEGQDYTKYDKTTTTITTPPGGVTVEYQSFSTLEDAVQDKTYVPTIGDIAHINGDPEKSDEEYWLQYTAKKVWKECCKPGVQYAFNAATMPHALVRTSDGTFVFTPLSWGHRLVGSDDTNPLPSFVGDYIKHMFFYRNRLGFMTATTFVMSKPGDYFELFSMSSLQVLDNDPIDESANTRQVTNLHKTVVLGRKLILFSDREQFTIHSNDDPMSPKTIQIDPGTTYETTKYSQTASCGASCFFISPKNNYVDLMEFEDLLNDEMRAAANVSSHCPLFIPNGFIQMVASPTNNMIVMHSSAKPKSLWIYRFKTIEDARAQSAFSQWTFENPITTVALMDNKLMLVQAIGGGLGLSSLSLGCIPDGDFDWNVRLDQLVEVTSTNYNSTTGTSTLAMPYDVTGEAITIIDAKYGRAILNFTANADKIITLSGVKGSGNYMVGLKYDAQTTLSPWYIKNQQGTALIDGRLQIRNTTIQYADTGYFQVEIQNEGRDARTKEWTSNIIGKMAYGLTQLFDGDFKVGVRGRNTTTSIKIESDSYLPVRIAAISYEGMLTQRGQAL